MKHIARTSILYAVLFFVAATVIGGGYLYYRSQFPGPEKQAIVARFLSDPSSPSEQVRKVAIDSHEVVVASFKALDAAVMAILIACILAGAGFASLAIAARKPEENSRAL